MTRWPHLEMRVASNDITQPTDWRIRQSRHVFVVHLGGRMDALETELDGHGGSTGAANPGEVWSIPAGRNYASHARGGAIHFAELYLDPIGFAGAPQEVVALAGVRDDFLHSGVRQLAALVARDDDLSRMCAESLSRTLALYLCHHYGREAAAPSGKARGPSLSTQQTRLLRDTIQARIAEQITLEDLATLTDLTPHHLLIAFRETFGLTPWQHVIRQRLRQAQHLLGRTSQDITTIALACGFTSHSHLTTTFRRHFGQSPSAFRASAR